MKPRISTGSVQSLVGYQSNMARKPSTSGCSANIWKSWGTAVGDRDHGFDALVLIHAVQRPADEIDGEAPRRDGGIVFAWGPAFVKPPMPLRVASTRASVGCTGANAAQ